MLPQRPRILVGQISREILGLKTYLSHGETWATSSDHWWNAEGGTSHTRCWVGDSSAEQSLWTDGSWDWTAGVHERVLLGTLGINWTAYLRLRESNSLRVVGDGYILKYEILSNTAPTDWITRKRLSACFHRRIGFQLQAMIICCCRES